MLALALALSLAGSRSAYVAVGASDLGPVEGIGRLVLDRAAQRLFVAHGNRVLVLDARSGRSLGEVQGAVGAAQGIGLSTLTGQGFTDDGRDGFAIAFDLRSFKVTKLISTPKGADAIVVEPVSGHVFVLAGGSRAISVIDPRNDTVVASINTGETVEDAVSDGRGRVFVSGSENRDVLRIDGQSNAVTARWLTPDCARPHGLAYDRANQRLFLGCSNSKLLVMDGRSGQVTTELAIGRDVDSVAFDSRHRRLFSASGADGDITVYQQVLPDKYRALAPFRTALGKQQLVVDPASGTVFVAVDDAEAPATPNERSKASSGTLRVLMFDPTR